MTKPLASVAARPDVVARAAADISEPAEWQIGFVWASGDAMPRASVRASAVAPAPAARRCGAPPAALPPDNELWDVAAAAQFLKMSPSWIYKRVERGELPCVRVNGWALRFVPARLREWAEQGGRRARAGSTEA